MAKYRIEYLPLAHQGIPYIWVGHIGALVGSGPRVCQLRVSDSALLLLLWPMRVNGHDIPESAYTEPIYPIRAEFIVRAEVTESDFELVELSS